MRRMPILISLILGLLLASAATAQVPDAPPPDPFFAQGGDGPPGDGWQGRGPRGEGYDRGQRMGKHVEQLRLLKLLELLDLNEDQETEFIVAFRAFRKEMNALQEKRSESLMKLADALKAEKTNDTELELLTDQVVEAKREAQVLADRFFDDMSKRLTAEQLGKFVVFQERFERELLDRVKAFREGARKFKRSGQPGRDKDSM